MNLLIVLLKEVIIIDGIKIIRNMTSKFVAYEFIHEQQ